MKTNSLVCFRAFIVLLLISHAATRYLIKTQVRRLLFSTNLKLYYVLKGRLVSIPLFRNVLCKIIYSKIKFGICTQIVSMYYYTYTSQLTGAVTNPRVATGYHYYRGYSLVLHICCLGGIKWVCLDLFFFPIGHRWNTTYKQIIVDGLQIHIENIPVHTSASCFRNGP